MTERDLEAAEGDLAEQAAGVADEDAEGAAPPGEANDPVEGSAEVDPADRAEQQRTVGGDDDEYR